MNRCPLSASGWRRETSSLTYVIIPIDIVIDRKKPPGSACQHFPGGFFRGLYLIGRGGRRGRVELHRFFDALQQDFLIFPLHHAGHAEEVHDPPDFSDETEAEEPEKDVFEGVAQIEVVHAEKDPQNVGGGFFLFPGGVEGEGIVFLLV